MSEGATNLSDAAHHAADPIELPRPAAEPHPATEPQPSAEPQPQLSDAPQLSDVPQPQPPAVPTPLGVTVEATGNREVDALLERLADADSLPTASHLEVYEDVHRGLRDTLSALDSRPGPPVPVPRGHRTMEDDRS